MFQQRLKHLRYHQQDEARGLKALEEAEINGQLLLLGLNCWVVGLKTLVFSEVVELKTDAELGLKLQEDHHRITEAEIKKAGCAWLKELY